MINVIGLGYIGLPTALVFASHGFEVIGTDYNVDLVKCPVEKTITSNVQKPGAALVDRHV